MDRPKNVIVESWIPSLPLVKDKPAVPLKVNVPLTAVSVTLSVSASVSDTVKPVSTRSLSSFTVCGPLTVLTGE
ncbi:MAG: hypothetical protein EBR09_16260 [Proteobacteria bacterium]|nr:hypothetical protein [Pseudomonadota bacterium]